MAYNDESLIEATMKSFNSEWDITDLGEPAFFLGMQIRRDIVNGSITIDQEEYIKETIRMFNMTECTPSNVPHLVNIHRTKDMSPSTQAAHGEPV